YQNMLLDFNDINQSHKDAKERLAQKPYPKRLKTLLHTLAPKGVGFRKLGEVINILKGKQLNKELLLDYGKYPVMNGGIYASGYWNEYNT
ncbi:restriction endonuclease subunit S, partial [Helicobacter pylori]